MCLFKIHIIYVEGRKYTPLLKLRISNSNQGNGPQQSIISSIHSAEKNCWMVKTIEWVIFLLKDTVVPGTFIKNLGLMPSSWKKPLIICCNICMPQTWTLVPTTDFMLITWFIMINISRQFNYVIDWSCLCDKLVHSIQANFYVKVWSFITKFWI